MQKGVITQQEMKRGSLLPLCSSVFPGWHWLQWRPYAGRFCRFPDSWRVVDHCRITYTVGNRPYGYIGLGDISDWFSLAG